MAWIYTGISIVDAILLLLLVSPELMRERAHPKADAKAWDRVLARLTGPLGSTAMQVKSLVLTMKELFPGAKLVFDAFSPFLRWANNYRVTPTQVGARSHWALKDSQDLEKWSDGIRLLAERFPYQYPEPRLALAVRRNPFFARAIGVFHYQLQGGQHVREH
jgi:hypothetical protein